MSTGLKPPSDRRSKCFIGFDGSSVPDLFLHAKPCGWRSSRRGWSSTPADATGHVLGSRSGVVLHSAPKRQTRTG